MDTSHVVCAIANYWVVHDMVEVRVTTLNEHLAIKKYLSMAVSHGWTFERTLEIINKGTSVMTEIDAKLLRRKADDFGIEFKFNQTDYNFIRSVIKEAYLNAFNMDYVVEVVNEGNLSKTITEDEVIDLAHTFGFGLSKVHYVEPEEPIPVYDYAGRMKYNPMIHFNNGTPWSAEDVQYLIEFYNGIGPAELSISLGRTEYTVRSKAADLRKKGLLSKPNKRKNHKSQERNS